jgi:hypothetical protein
MRVRVLRSVAAFAAVLGLAVLAGCGGGGGGGGGTPTIPGTLAPLALEGTSAPGTGAGTFASFGPGIRLAVADGGWVAFVADVIGGTTQKGLFVARPDGTVVNVYLRGDTVPTPGTGSGSGTIDDFQRVWITSNGVVVAKISILSGSTAGIISARVPASGAAVEKAGVIYHGTPLVAGLSGAPQGTANALFDDLIRVDDQGDVFLVSGGTLGGFGVWTFKRTGLTPLALAASGDAAPPGGGTLGFDFDGLGIDGNGLVVAFAVNVLGGPTHAIIAKNNSGVAGVYVSKNGDTHASIGGRIFENVYDSGPIYVTYGNATSYVTWQADLDGAAPDKAIFTRQVVGSDVLTTGPLLAMAVPGQSVPGAGPGAFMSTIRLLDGANGPNLIPIMVDVALGTTTRIVARCPSPTSLSTVTYQGEVVPPPAETTFTANYPSLTALDGKVNDYTGSLAFSAALANGSSGVYWSIFNYGFFQIVRQGDAVPGLPGVTFAPFIGSGPVIPASGCVVFPANLIGGTNPTGLFRQR